MALHKAGQESAALTYAIQVCEVVERMATRWVRGTARHPPRPADMLLVTLLVTVRHTGALCCLIAVCLVLLVRAAADKATSLQGRTIPALVSLIDHLRPRHMTVICGVYSPAVKCLCCGPEAPGWSRTVALQHVYTTGGQHAAQAGPGTNTAATSAPTAAAAAAAPVMIPATTTFAIMNARVLNTVHGLHVCGSSWRCTMQAAPKPCRQHQAAAGQAVHKPSRLQGQAKQGQA